MAVWCASHNRQSQSLVTCVAVYPTQAAIVNRPRHRQVWPGCLCSRSFKMGATFSSPCSNLSPPPETLFNYYVLIMQSQFKTASKMCRHGTREDCPISNCRFQHSNVPLMSSTPLRSQAQCLRLRRQFRAPQGLIFPPTEQGYTRLVRQREGLCAAVSSPSVENAVLAPDANALAQGSYFLTARASIRLRIFWATADIIAATDGLALYRAWLESQVEVQKARIQAMSKQYSIPIPQLDLDPFDFPPLGMIPNHG
ncbi:hypothetical protein EDB83DRAFT_2629978 [Lactarius deliciosus]|nr:hypothetical protein EDB83DRAFT_2629978 [Lactarius deliciosus]